MSSEPLDVVRITLEKALSDGGFDLATLSPIRINDFTLIESDLARGEGFERRMAAVVLLPGNG